MELINLKKVQVSKKKVTGSTLTREEKLIWDNLKDRRLEKVKFKRNIEMGKYKFHFYAPSIEFAIAIDNAVKHTRNYIRTRDEYMESNGITYISFSSSEIRGNLEGVLKTINEKVLEIKG